MTESLEDFDFEQYLKEKTLKILGENSGVKLSALTLTRLAKKGIRLIPPLNL